MPDNNPIKRNTLEGPLGVLNITFDNIVIGKSMGGCKIEEVKDICYKIVPGQSLLAKTPLSK